MNEKPILFSGAMVKALLEGRKTQTRRVITPRPWNREGDCVDINAAIRAHYSKGADGRFYAQFDHPKGGPLTAYTSPYEVGQKRWVRETFKVNPFNQYVYAANTPASKAETVDHAFGPWKPSIFMPRAASRITLEITDVRVQRLQEITEADATDEGFDGLSWFQEKSGDKRLYGTEAFRVLWDKLNAKRDYSWDSNPWVWALTLRRVSQ